jgi:hypothetical protein
MKTLILLISTGLVLSAAGQDKSQDTQSNDSKKTAPKKVTRTPDPPTIPKDATALPDGSFRYVDKGGKKWIYRNTPFGVSKSEERPAVQMVQQPSEDPVKTQDLGDSVRFSRPTPFGPKVWTKKKTDLDSYEKTIWDRDHPKDASKQDSTPSSTKQD